MDARNCVAGCCLHIRFQVGIGSNKPRKNLERRERSGAELPGGWSRSAARRRACRPSLIPPSADCHGGSGAAVVTLIGFSRETERERERRGSSFNIIRAEDLLFGDLSELLVSARMHERTSWRPWEGRVEGEGPARETGGACLTVPVQTSGAPGQPEEPDTIHQILIRCFWIQSGRRALTQTGNSAHFWMMALIMRAPDVTADGRTPTLSRAVTDIAPQPADRPGAPPLHYSCLSFLSY